MESLGDALWLGSSYFLVFRGRENLCWVLRPLVVMVSVRHCWLLGCLMWGGLHWRYRDKERNIPSSLGLALFLLISKGSSEAAHLATLADPPLHSIVNNAFTIFVAHAWFIARRFKSCLHGGACFCVHAKHPKTSWHGFMPTFPPKLLNQVDALSYKPDHQPVSSQCMDRQAKDWWPISRYLSDLRICCQGCMQNAWFHTSIGANTAWWLLWSWSAVHHT